MQEGRNKRRMCVFTGRVHPLPHDAGDNGRHVGVRAPAIHTGHPLHAGPLNRTLLATVLGRF